MDNFRTLVFCNFVIHNNIQWLWSLNFNALFSRNMISGEINKWGSYIKRNENCNGSAYNNVILYGNKIVAIPGSERKIMIFDIVTKIFRYVDLEMQFIKENENAFFSYVVSEDRWLFMIGNEIPYVIKFDMEMESISGIVSLNFYIPKRNIYFRDAVLDKDKVLIPSLEDNMVFEIDTKTLLWTKKSPGLSEDGFSAICRDENCIWLMPRQKGAILQWNIEKNHVLAHEIEKEGFKYVPMKNNFYSGHFIGKKIWVFPFRNNMVFSIDIKTGRISKDNAINRYLFCEQEESRECAFRAVQENQGTIFLLCSVGGEWVNLEYIPEMDELKILAAGYEIPYGEYFAYLDTRGIGFIMNEKDIPFRNFADYVAFLYSNNMKNINDSTKNITGCQIWKAID